jgi:tetratricopeptide (TPR) repeat protein
MRKLVLVAFCLALPASAQTGGCTEKVAGSTSQAVIAACTAVIEAGQGSRRDLAAAYVNRANAHLSARELRAARQDAEQAIALDPDYPEGHIRLATAYNLDGNHDRAVAEDSIAIRLDPDNGTAYNNRGTAYYYMQEYDEALRDYDRAIRLEPDNYSFYQNRLSLFWAVNRYEQAVPDAEALKRIAPQQPAAWNMACWARAIWGRELETALADCDRAVTLDGGKAAAVFDSRCLVKFRMEQYAGAAADCSAALRLDPALAASLYIRGLAEIRLGDRRRGGEDVAEAQRHTRHIADTYARYGIEPPPAE